MTKETMPKIIEIGGVKYQRLEEPETPTLYEFFKEWSKGYSVDRYLDSYDVYNFVEQFINYLYECCEIVEESNENMTVIISQKQLVCPLVCSDKCLEDSND